MTQADERMDGLESALDVSRDDDHAESTSGPHEETSFGRWLIETAVLVLLAFALAQGIKSYVIQPFIVPTGSMLPTIQLKDRVLAEKITYRFDHGPRVGDIVVFDDPAGMHPQLIKRVIAVAGQTVDVHDGGVYVDGKRLDEPYTYGKPSELGSISLPVTLGKDEVWLMGDNRPDSGDSRFFGPRPVSTVRGRAFWTYWPLNRFGKLE